MSRQYGFNRNANILRRVMSQLAKTANDSSTYHSVMHELVKVGLVTAVNGMYKPAENVKDAQLAILVDRLNARFSPSTCCGFIETGCTILPSTDFALDKISAKREIARFRS